MVYLVNQTIDFGVRLVIQQGIKSDCHSVPCRIINSFDQRLLGLVDYLASSVHPREWLVPEQRSGGSGKESAELTQRRGNLKTHVPRSSSVRGKYIARYHRHCRLRRRRRRRRDLF